MDQARAIELVEHRLKEIGQPGYTYSVCGAREHPDTWAIAVEAYRPDGQRTYDLMGFDIDKQTGDVRQMT
jgi:hypothetical protein